ncbi:hypothetical protein D9M71_282760 [compost metagenome]
MQQRQVGEVLRRVHAAAGIEQRRAAHREGVEGGDQLDVQVRPVADAIGDEQVDVAVAHVVRHPRRHQAQFHPRMGALELADLVAQPVGGEPGRATDAQPPGNLLGIGETPRLVEDRQRTLGLAGEAFSLVGEHDATPGAFGKGDAEAVLQRMQLVAHRTAGQAQLAGGLGQTAQPGDGIEHAQRGHRGETHGWALQSSVAGKSAAYVGRVKPATTDRHRGGLHPPYGLRAGISPDALPVGARGTPTISYRYPGNARA